MLKDFSSRYAFSKHHFREHRDTNFNSMLIAKIVCQKEIVTRRNEEY